MKRLYGDEKREALYVYYDSFVEEVDQLFFRKF